MRTTLIIVTAATVLGAGAQAGRAAEPEAPAKPAVYDQSGSQLCAPIRSVCAPIPADSDCTDAGERTFDQRGRLVRKEAAPGKFWYYQYDDTGALLRKVDPAGGQWRLTWANNEVVQVVTPKGTVVLCGT